MFVGHYAAAFALKRVEPRASLWALFLGVQWVDIVFFPLALAGVERLRIVENFTESTHFELVYMPYTHSLLATLIWGAAAYVVLRYAARLAAPVAAVLAVAVMSHWLLDVLVHTPDLPLWSDSSPKVGLGLWNNAVATYALEAVLLVAAALWYLGGTSPLGRAGRYAAPLLLALLLAVNAVNIFGPPTAAELAPLAVVSLASYLLLAALAAAVERQRVA